MGRDPLADPRDRRQKRSRSAIRVSLEAIEAVGAGRPLRIALASALRDAPGLGGKERRHVAEAARGVARWLRPIDVALARAGAPKRPHPADRALLRYLAWRVSILGEPAGAVASALALPGPRTPRAIGDDVLAGVALRLPLASALPVPSDPVVALALRESVPDFFARRLVDAFGLDEASACLAALNAPSGFSLRVNTQLASRDQALAALLESGVSATAGEGPASIQIDDRAGLFGGLPFRRGWVEVQDEGSQAVVDACAAKRGERWLDFCAGSGGKALALAARGASVTAWDADPRRLAELPRRARKARARIEVARSAPAERFDGVLVDAPCSGSGALHREPDARWRITPEAIARFGKEQEAILARASERVRPGGVLVYATCSLLPEEGEAIVDGFLATHRGFAIETRERRWPQRQAGGAFFIARLRAQERTGRPRSRVAARS